MTPADLIAQFTQTANPSRSPAGRVRPPVHAGITKQSSGQPDHRNESDDSAVRALANAFAVRYETAHAFLASCGRENHANICFDSVASALGLSPQPGHSRCSLLQFVTDHTTGIFILVSPRRAITVREGVVFDDVARFENLKIDSVYDASAWGGVPRFSDPAPDSEFRRLIRSTAEIRMRQWLEDYRNVKQQLGRGDSAMTMASNAEGKIIEEAMTAKANAIRSLGVKEGTPVAKFTERPGLIAAAIERGAGRLYQWILDAFMRDIQDNEGAEIMEWIDKERGLLDDTGSITFTAGESTPLLGGTPAEAMTIAVAGRRTELLKEGKQFDEQRLVESDLFQGRGGAQKRLADA